MCSLILVRSGVDRIVFNEKVISSCNTIENLILKAPSPTHRILKSTASKLETDCWDVVDNFLDPEHYEELFTLSETNEDWIDSSTFWGKVLYEGDKASAVKNNVLVSKKLWRFHDHSPGPIYRFQNKLLTYMKMDVDTIIPKSFWTRIYRYPEQSSIYWHDDGISDGITNYGFSYYLNREWDPNWGGEFLIEGGKWLAPTRNRLTVVKAPRMHRTTQTEQNAPDRISLQTFFAIGEKKERI